MAKFSLDLARELLDFCIQSYKPMAEMDLASMGFELVRYFEDGRTDTQAFIAKDEGRIVVVFRGTQTKEDIFTDLKIKKLNHPPMKRWFFKSKVHKGFLEAYKSIDDEIRATVRQVLDEKPYLVFCTGHSLGGALAHISALDIQETLMTPVTVYSFGSPRVGNRWWRRHYNGKVLNSFRVVNDDDIVPSVPSKLVGYRHVDSLALIDEEKIIYVNPSKDKVREKEIEGWTSVMNEGIEEHRSGFYKILLDKIDDVLDVGVTGHD